MTTLTNLKGLPAPIVEAIINDDYDRGDSDISVTGLLAPPRISALVEQYKDHLVEDASDRIWSLLGKSVHAMIDKSSSYGLSEERLFTTSRGWKVSGQFDHLSLREQEGKAVLNDWKVTSVYTLLSGSDRVIEWEKQLNMYALLLFEHGHDIDEIEIIAILRDWQNSRRGDDDYPDSAARSVPLSLWSPQEARRFMDERVAEHQKAREVLPQCSDEDRWAKPNKYAAYGVTKAGTRTARAKRLFDDEAEAYDYATAIGGDVEYRQGDQWVRCRQYCPVVNFCTQFQEGGDTGTPQ